MKKLHLSWHIWKLQLHPIITPLILDQLACSLPKTNTTFHQLFNYAKKDATFSSIRWENSKNIFGRLYLRSTVVNLFLSLLLAGVWDKYFPCEIIPLFIIDIPWYPDISLTFDYTHTQRFDLHTARKKSFWFIWPK